MNRRLGRSINTHMADIVDMNQASSPKGHDPLVCHCLNVRQSALDDAIDQHDAASVDELRLKTGAGAGCGSCHLRMERHLQGLSNECGPCSYCTGCNSIKALCACEVA